ncbi:MULTISPECIES: alpha/beta fold hydrolase [Cryobacterium]|uniref:Alpha/beta hydrolase n=1 Tax=Cryobacterium shii TaxID=1259235 RepID=A0AAQ2C908_9MICO|nr:MULTISPECIES: alpha/beta hydrolase [Cryobacterium]TFC52917.1 alpha/beta hydrolase [Cryobacterium shii]TFD18835.1 alpha/beta hydrolase [Cryobacterium sp. TMT4-10]
MPPRTATTGTKISTDARAIARRTGTLLGGMPYLRFGTGTPLVVLPGFGQNNEPTVGFERMFVSQTLMPLAANHRILRLTSRPGLDPNSTMKEIARDYADALRLEFPGPVDVMGISTGGSIALQLAADHPDVVQRLIVVSAAYKLGPVGKEVQSRVAEEVAAGRPRRAGLEMFRTLGTSAFTRWLSGGMGWLLGPAMLGKATPDMMAIIHAEDGFNLRDRLSEIDAPTLVVGGDRDGGYPVELFRQTAALIPNGRAIVYPGQGHMVVTSEPRLMQDVLEFLDGWSPNTPDPAP